MRTCVLMIGCIVMGVLGAPVAQADNASFVRDAHALGFLHAADNLISTAESACYFLSLNRAPGQVEQRIQRYTRVGPSQAHQFFTMAVNEYCPQYAGLVGP